LMCPTDGSIPELYLLAAYYVIDLLN